VLKIADRIMEYSSGVPRIVNEMTKILSKPTIDAQRTAFLVSDKGEEELMMLLKPNINFPVLRAADLEEESGSDGEMSYDKSIRGDAIIAHLYYHACVGTELVKEEPLPYFDLFEPRSRPVDELIDIYSLYSQPSSTVEGKIKHVFPKAWRYFLSATAIFAWNFLRYLNSEVADVGKVWESVVRKSIRYRSFIFSDKSIADAFPFLANTCLASKVVKGFPVQELDFQAKATTVKAIIDDYVLGKPDFPRQIIPLERSKFPDTLVVFEKDVNGNYPFLANQDKYMDSNFSYRDVMEEISKVIPLLHATRVNSARETGSNGVMAFFLSGTANADIQAMRGEILSHPSFTVHGAYCQT